MGVFLSALQLGGGIVDLEREREGSIWKVKVLDATISTWIRCRY